MPVQLNEVHRQRIALAVEAERQGGTVVFRIDRDELGGKAVIWFAKERPAIRRKICNDMGGMEPWLRAVEEEFGKQKRAVQASGLGGKAEVIQ